MIFLFKAMRLGNAIKAIVVGITELNSSGWNSDRKEKNIVQDGTDQRPKGIFYFTKWVDFQVLGHVEDYPLEGRRFSFLLVTS